MTITLGFDVGTSRTKALVYDTAERLVLACVSEATPVKAGPHGDLRDADELWALLARLCQRLNKAGAPLHRIKGVSLASIGEEVVFLDERGLPTAPVPCWYVEQPADAVEGEDLPQFRLASWYAIRAADRRGELALLTATSFTDLGSSLLTRLVAARQPHMDRSHASRTGLLNRNNGRWSAERLHSCGADSLQPPKLVDSGTYVGALDSAAAALTGLPSGVPVYSGAHDHMCAALAAGAELSGDVLVSVGTSESRLILVDLPWRELSSRERPGREVGLFADGRHGYLHTSSPSGMRVDEIVSNDPSGRDIAAVYKALASMVSVDSEGSLALAVGTPESDPSAAALFVELNRQAIQSAAAINEMTELVGGDTQRITIIGVPTQHEIWRRIAASTQITRLSSWKSKNSRRWVQHCWQRVASESLRHEMSRIRTEELIDAARNASTGIAALNVIQLEHAEAIVRAAELVSRPVILQLSENAISYHGVLGPIAAALRSIANAASVPVALHLDHATSIDLCREAVDLGFDSVMIDASAEPWEKNLHTTAEVVDLCATGGIWVEAEIGEVGGKGAHAPGARTEPEEAARFVAETGVDGLAIAIGSQHAMRDRSAVIDRELLHRIRQGVPVPLVLHGSSGLSDAEISAAIAGGITKINVGTQLNIAFTGAVRAALSADSTLVDPRRYLGGGRLALQRIAAELIELITPQPIT